MNLIVLTPKYTMASGEELPTFRRSAVPHVQDEEALTEGWTVWPRKGRQDAPATPESICQSTRCNIPTRLESLSVPLREPPISRTHACTHISVPKSAGRIPQTPWPGHGTVDQSNEIRFSPWVRDLVFCKASRPARGPSYTYRAVWQTQREPDQSPSHFAEDKSLYLKSAFKTSRTDAQLSADDTLL